MTVTERQSRSAPTPPGEHSHLSGCVCAVSSAVRRISNGAARAASRSRKSALIASIYYMGDNECLAPVSESVTEAVGAVQRGGFCASSEPAALLVPLFWCGTHLVRFTSCFLSFYRSWPRAVWCTYKYVISLTVKSEVVTSPCIILGCTESVLMHSSLQLHGPVLQWRELLCDGPGWSCT